MVLHVRCLVMNNVPARSDVVQKALSLIGKLQYKYGFKPKFYKHIPAPRRVPEVQGELPTIVEEVIEESEEPPSTDDKGAGEWCLVNSSGYIYRLPKTMMFLGREECDIEVQSETVDKRHAVITFDHYLKRFKIKDLSTNNGTFVNESRIPEQEYVTLDCKDTVRLGFECTMFHMERLEERSANGTHYEGEEEREGGAFAGQDEDLPSWASHKCDSQDIQSPMAECEGCIAEQRIEHTCGEDEPECHTAHHDLDRSYSHDNIATFSLGHNTWPKKRHKATFKKNVKEIFGMAEEEVPHIEGLIDTPQGRVLRGTGAPMNILPAGKGLIDTPQGRVPRGTGAPMNILPAELETVKKGTPLYGQPKWWGEDDSDLNEGKLRSNGSMDSQSHGTKSGHSADPGQSTPRRNNVSASGNSQSPGYTGPEPSDTDSASATAAAASRRKSSTTPEGITNMAFTIDFGEDSQKTLEGKSLSEFVPSKIRKSFRERKEKTLDKSLEKEKCTVTSKVSTPAVANEKVTPEKTNGAHNLGRAQSEGRDISPTRQRKIDEIWSSTTSSESLSGRRQRMLVKSATSRSMEFDEDRSESSYAKATKSSSVKRRPAMNNSSQPKPKSVIRARKAVSQEILASSTQYTSDNASYLINRMFEKRSTGSVDSLKLKGADDSMTEYDLYQEAVKYDTNQSRTMSQDLNMSVKKSRSKEVPTSILKKSNEEIPSAKKENEEDKTSETGTYTIEEEKDAKEEEEARKNIDKLFGVDQLSVTGSSNLTDDLKGRVLQQGDKQGDLTKNLEHLNQELEEIERLEKLRAQRPSADSLDVDVGSAQASEVFEDEENPAVPNDAPTWVTQWAALTSQKAKNKSDMDLSSPGSSISDDAGKSGTKAQNGTSRKRPGTGRRLPTIPPGTSPTLSENSVTKESPKASKSDLSINGIAPPVQASRQRAVKISSHVSARYQDTDSESISQVKCEEDNSESSRRKSNGSVVSIDTDVLLKDTETVMAAMEQRVSSKPNTGANRVQENGHNGHGYDIDVHLDESFQSQESSRYGGDMNGSGGLNESVDCDSDASSMVALVNGDDDFVKPSLYKSPREALGRGKLKLSGSLPSKPNVNMSGAKSKHSEKEKFRRRSEEESKSVVSDVYSEVTDKTTTRSVDSDNTETGGFVRQGSKGKGTMSMTRPNRAFALRRARADGDEPMDSNRSSSTYNIASSTFSTPRSSGSLSNVSKLSSTPQKPRRPLSGKFSERVPDSGRSQASLGAQIVQKSRDNSRADNFARTDGGRHSLRVARSLSIPARQPSTPSSTTKSRRSEATTTSQVQHSKSLRVTGVSARERSGSVSNKTTSGTNSPKSAERNAWRRRKEYDPRRAVAESKSKTKDSSSRHRAREPDSYSKSRVTRSASFTNTRDLKLSSYQCDSLSTTDDSVSHRSSVASDVFDERPNRGFVPYSGRLGSSKVSTTSSADEDELEKYTRSSSSHSTQISKLMRRRPESKSPSHHSAFTPPPRKPLPLSVFVATEARPSTRKPPCSAPKSQTLPKSNRQPAASSQRVWSKMSRTSKLRLKTPSPPPATRAAMLHHRRSVDSLKMHEHVLGGGSTINSNQRPLVVESYDTIIVSSIYQLSMKLKTLTDKTMDKLRDTDETENGTASPIDDLDNQPISEIPAFKSANQELAGVLKNLRKLEKHIRVMNKALFPDDEQSPDTSREKHEYMQQIERIRNELAGFQPIETPRDDVWKQSDAVSVESDCEELSHGEFY